MAGQSGSSIPRHIGVLKMSDGSTWYGPSYLSPSLGDGHHGHRPRGACSGPKQVDSGDSGSLWVGFSLLSLEVPVGVALIR